MLSSDIIDQTEDRLNFTTFTSELNVDINSLKNNDKENTIKLLKLIFHFKEKNKLNLEQLKKLMLLIVNDGKVDMAHIKSMLKIKDLVLNAILGALETKDLLGFDTYSEEVTITDKFNSEIYELGVFSIPNHLDILSNVFFSGS